MKYEKDLYLIQQIFATIFTLSNKIQVKGDQSLNSLTTRQMMLMTAILHLPNGKATHSNLAKMLGSTRQSVKQLISILENKGYIVSVPSALDKRATEIQITDTGKTAVMISAEQSIHLFTEMFSKFTTRELELLWLLLKKLYYYDGNEPLNFEENINYGDSEDFTESQLQTLEKFDARRAKIEMEGDSIE
ncbi:MarR family winged helix-turn-helix transcriptional regulator [Anaerocolumna sp. MB42-C2]|uniref:MarR family winged helix-turn-helix transcriptional regulator n=1 Tax=Anaerocolumna sp. MB42-C2 TaxID=3070997 RepID=UPI0027E204EE|nr:MarR family winged helix-turn-helix transcriptional regulator [Anaerocolumna sp. MB42-C2]WMJ86940.1 MarR family winged helix-turn-helix transcriptional regulator [Anaerocolumna sp. MB42-C2]